MRGKITIVIMLFCIIAIAILPNAVESGIPFPKFGLGNRGQKDNKKRRQATSNDNDNKEMSNSNSNYDEHYCNDEFYAPSSNNNDNTNSNIRYEQQSRNNMNMNNNNGNNNNGNYEGRHHKNSLSSQQIYSVEEVMNTDEADSINSISQFEPLQVMCEVNGYLVPAIIDTGAQITIMSSACAKRCHVSSNIDTRYAGRAIGIGSSDIIGRINGLEMRIGPVNFKNEVSILREARVDFLIGMDFLKRFKCDVSFNDHCLRLRVKDKRFKVPLLSDNSNSIDRKSFSGIETKNSDDNSYSDDVIEMNAVNTAANFNIVASSKSGSDDLSFASVKYGNNDVFEYESDYENLGEPCSMEGV